MAPDDPPHSLRSPSDASRVQAEWRERNLGPALLTASSLGSLVIGAGILRQSAPRRGLVLALEAALVVVLWTASNAPRLSPRLRAGAALGALYAAGMRALIATGPSAEAVAAFAGFGALAFLLWDARRARIAAVLSAAPLAAHAAAVGLGLVPSGWSYSGPGAVLYSALLAVGVLNTAWAVRWLVRQLAGAQADQGKLRAEIEQEQRERKRAQSQLSETQERLLHAHKLEVVGRLAGGIAHDFNNTLTVILSYGELIKTRLGREHPVAELADQIIQAAEQGGDLTRQLLTFTRRQIVKPRPVDVQQVLRNTERALSRLIPRTIRVRRSESPEELYVTIDPTQLQQAILNLALNARDAMPAGGDLFLEASAVHLREPGDLPLIRGDYVVIRVRDSGTGMTPETLGRLFEPFFTTKEPGLGTGLGLANVRETTETAGGHVAVKSAVGTGSELTLYLPRSDPRISGVETMPHARPARHHTVLVVDDEPQIREVIRTMLADNEYIVRTADNARSALEILRSEHVDLVCTDLVMPEMSGSKLIDELKRTQPRLPVVVCSAYGTDDEVSRRVTRGEVLFLSKPFTRKELLDVVGRALSSQPKQPNGRPLAAG